MKYIYFFTYLYSFLIFFSSHADELDWQKAQFNSINYSRIGINGGAALYTLPSKDTLKFNIQVVFPNSLFTLSESSQTELNALSDMLILGGFDNKSYEQIQKDLMQNGIGLSTSINDLGEIVVASEALTEDFQKVLTIVTNLILKPKFEPKALNLWKQQTKSQFMNLTNANTLSIQKLFINLEAAHLAFGPEHYFATKLQYTSPKYTQAVTMEKIKELYQKMLNRNGLNVLLSGAYPSTAQTALIHMIGQIPEKNLPVITWLPGRLLESDKNPSIIKTGVIQKNDMTQCQISLKLYYPNLGELNPIEKAQMTILTDIFSSTVGVIGNDRFSKAMRENSGLSYGPRAYFTSQILAPNTNLSSFTMDFQSPNERLVEAFQLAKKTWDEFIQNGVTMDELDRTRSSVMNSMLAKEFTVFDKAGFFFSKILYGRVPSVNPIQENLESLDKQKNVEMLNAFLKKAFSNPRGVLVIMGNPPKDQIEKLKTIPTLDIIEMKSVNSFL